MLRNTALVQTYIHQPLQQKVPWYTFTAYIRYKAWYISNKSFNLLRQIKICTYTHAYIHSNAISTRANLSRYYIRHCENSVRNLIRFLESRQTPHTLTSRARSSYGLSIVRILEICYGVIKATCYIYIYICVCVCVSVCVRISVCFCVSVCLCVCLVAKDISFLGWIFVWCFNATALIDTCREAAIKGCQVV